MRHSTGPAPSEEANELGSLGTPAATNHKCKDNKPAPLRAQQLKVGAFFSCACEAKRGATVLPLAPACSPTGVDRGHKGGVNGKLPPESVGDDLDAAVIEVFGVDVEVTHWRQQ